jgi:hypothetical protein
VEVVLELLVHLDLPQELPVDQVVVVVQTLDPVTKEVVAVLQLNHQLRNQEHLEPLELITLGMEMVVDLAQLLLEITLLAVVVVVLVALAQIHHFLQLPVQEEMVDLDNHLLDSLRQFLHQQFLDQLNLLLLLP